jgi:hypothetical protein
MEKQALILQQTSAFVQKDFEVENIPEDVTEQELIDFLEQFVQTLLDTNMEQLFYVLYRLDINEFKVHQALNPAAIEPPHKALAQLIFQREKQKAKTRIEYNERYTEEGDGWDK